jgi:3-phenylpropionate/trans-cinnamate dioxygenase ferredoxin reductase subunit
LALNIIVLGGGQAAASFAAKMRELDPACAITIIGEEPSLPYQRPPLSKKYMTGEMSGERLLLRPQEWYAEAGVTCRLSATAVSVSAGQKTVTLADGTVLPYDKLVFATGSTPRRLPPAIGGDLEGVYVLRNLADADRLALEMKPGRRVLVIGGGYIGLEAAAVAATLGLKVHVAEMASRILQRVAAPQTSDYFRQLHAGHGVEIMEEKALERLVGENGHVMRAQFKDGTSIDVDFVLVGIGVTPNEALAREAGLDTANGICVDHSARTSDPDIYAAGDCASFEFRGQRIRLESVQNAIDQGEIAARAIAGEAVDYRPVPWFWSDQYDVKLQIAGLNIGYDRTVARPGPREGAVSIWYFAGNNFVAVDSINDSKTYMFGKRILELGRNLGPQEAQDPAFDLKALIR